MFPRNIKLPKSNSFFLFGPRGTGKSTLLRERFGEDSVFKIDLLLHQTEHQYARDPDLLYRQVKALPETKTIVVIDEVQKLPKLLDIVHKLIEETNKQFVLTGSSARKLKQGSANLLAGRAFERDLHPLTFEELGDAFDIESVMQWGSLPGLYQHASPEDRIDFLMAYTNTYLREEVAGEQLIRKLDPFRKFLEVAAQHNGMQINFSNIAADVGVDPKTVQSYFLILEDTLVGFHLEPYLKSARKRVHKAPKFYFFDLGVTRALANLLTLPPHPSTSYYVDLFEHLVVLEALRKESYAKTGARFFYYAEDNQSVDLVIERPGKKLALVEIKSTDRMQEKHLKGLKACAKRFPDAELYCLSRDLQAQVMEDVRIYPWQEGLSVILSAVGLS
jgi:predicted AAA+ superfamily ATPase